MKAFAIALLVVSASICSPTLAPKPVTVAGTPWLSNWADAKEEARKRSKPILMLQMMGQLDDVFC